MLKREDLENLNLSGVTITAAIQPDGSLQPVGGMFEKLLAAARETLPRIHTVIVAPNQEGVPDEHTHPSAHPWVVEKSTIEEAIQFSRPLVRGLGQHAQKVREGRIIEPLVCRELGMTLDEFFFGTASEPPYYIDIKVQQWLEENRWSEDAVDLDDAVCESDDPILLVGDSGSGKTVRLLKFFIDAVHPKGKLTSMGFLPYWVDLKRHDIESREKLFGDISADSEERNVLQDELGIISGVVFLFDLNEVPAHDRNRGPEQIVQLVQDLKGQHKVIVAYRTYGLALEQDEVFQEFVRRRNEQVRFRIFRLQPLKFDQAQTYFDRIVGQDTSRHRLRQIYDRMDEQQQRMIENPLMLHFMSMLPTEQLERISTVAALYKAVVDLGLEREHERERTEPYTTMGQRLNRSPDLRRTRRKLLQLLAHRMIQRGVLQLTDEEAIEALANRLQQHPDDDKDWWPEMRYEGEWCRVGLETRGGQRVVNETELRGLLEWLCKTGLLSVQRDD